jgi:hypothetical protein
MPEKINKKLYNTILDNENKINYNESNRTQHLGLNINILNSAEVVRSRKTLTAETYEKINHGI